jgi:hypothetical protein
MRKNGDRSPEPDSEFTYSSQMSGVDNDMRSFSNAIKRQTARRSRAIREGLAVKTISIEGR